MTTFLWRRSALSCCLPESRRGDFFESRKETCAWDLVTTFGLVLADLGTRVEDDADECCPDEARDEAGPGAEYVLEPALCCEANESFTVVPLERSTHLPRVAHADS